MRTVRLKGPFMAPLTEEVLLLANAEGVVEHVTNLSRKQPELFDRQIAKLDSIRLSWSGPDERAWKAVRRGLLTCGPASGCALVLDVPGLPRLYSEDLRSIRIESLEPKEGSTLARGQRVTVTATVRYELHSDPSMAMLMIQDQTRMALIASPVSQVAKPGTGEITLTGSFTVPDSATRIDVLLALMDPRLGSTSTVASATYEVR
jgi:hypothetical protein